MCSQDLSQFHAFWRKGEEGWRKNKLCSAVLFSELRLYAFTTVQKKSSWNTTSFQEPCTNMGNNPNNSFWLRSLQKERHLIVYNISTLVLNTSNDEMLLLGLYAQSFFKSLMEICKHITLGWISEPFSVSSISSILEVWEETKRRGLGNSSCKLCCLTNFGIHSFQKQTPVVCCFFPQAYYKLFLRHIENKTSCI